MTTQLGVLAPAEPPALESGGAAMVRPLGAGGAFPAVLAAQVPRVGAAFAPAGDVDMTAKAVKELASAGSARAPVARAMRAATAESERLRPRPEAEETPQKKAFLAKDRTRERAEKPLQAGTDRPARAPAPVRPAPGPTAVARGQNPESLDRHHPRAEIAAGPAAGGANEDPPARVDVKHPNAEAARRQAVPEGPPAAPKPTVETPEPLPELARPGEPVSAPAAQAAGAAQTASGAPVEDGLAEEMKQSGGRARARVVAPEVTNAAPSVGVSARERAPAAPASAAPAQAPASQAAPPREHPATAPPSAVVSDVRDGSARVATSGREAEATAAGTAPRREGAPAKAPQAAPVQAIGRGAPVAKDVAPAKPVRVAVPAGGRPAGAARAGAQAQAAAAQFSRGLSAALRQGGGTVTLRLSPENLGDLKIKLEMEAGKVAAQFRVETAAARRLLGESLGSLRTALEARGLEVQSLSVHVAERTSPAPEAQGQPEHSWDQGAGGRHGDQQGNAGGGAAHHHGARQRHAGHTHSGRAGMPPGTPAPLGATVAPAGGRGGLDAIA